MSTSYTVPPQFSYIFTFPMNTLRGTLHLLHINTYINEQVLLGQTMADL